MTVEGGETPLLCFYRPTPRPLLEPKQHHASTSWSLCTDQFLHRWPWRTSKTMLSLFLSEYFNFSMFLLSFFCELFEKKYRYFSSFFLFVYSQNLFLSNKIWFVRNIAQLNLRSDGADSSGIVIMIKGTTQKRYICDVRDIIGDSSKVTQKVQK